MTMATKYKGYYIIRCHWADGEHDGKWYVQSRHETGMQWADEATPHHRSLEAAKGYITDMKEGAL